MQTSSAVLKATPQDQHHAVDLLVRAFETDPPLNWLLRKGEQRPAAMREFFAVAFRTMTFPFGCVELTADGSGVALWTPPHRWQLNLLKQLSLLPTFLRVLGPGQFLPKMSGINTVQSRHPKEPHYYLFAMGVEPDLQGRGIGSLLLRSMLDRCDQAGLPAYLESSTEGSRRLYERFGFETKEVLRMGPDAPPIWTMWRTPR